MLLVREQDVRQVGEIRQQQFESLLDRHGPVGSPGAPQVDPDGEPPCPCCGTAAPLVNGACSDCGLQLA